MKKEEEHITGRHRVCGVIGDPIAHTLSPLIHNKLALSEGQAMVYVPFHVTEPYVATALKGAHALGIRGLNVTMPHKQAAFREAVRLDESALQADAVNTLIYSEAGYIGYNTDYEGLALSLKEYGVEWKNKNVAIIGSGGAAYAAYIAVAKEAQAIYIFNRTVSKAEKLKDHMAKYFNTPTFIYGEDRMCQEPMEIVIQTTGVGMGDYSHQMPKCTQEVLEKAKVAVDLIYHPEETLFLQYAKSKGCLCINGFGMLFYQALRAFELMHGISCKEENILKIKRELSKYMEV